MRDRQLPFAKIIPLANAGQAEDLRLVAAGLMRKAERTLPASFWGVRRACVERKAAANAVARDRDGD